ncbi:hypothetical protein ACLOJK_027733 [Asimina triloba]
MVREQGREERDGDRGRLIGKVENCKVGNGDGTRKKDWAGKGGGCEIENREKEGDEEGGDKQRERERRRETKREVTNRESARERGRTQKKDGVREGGGCEIGNKESTRKIRQEIEVATRSRKRKRGKDRAGDGGPK